MLGQGAAGRLGAGGLWASGTPDCDRVNDDDYLQQSFLRMKMDFNTRRNKLPMELTLMRMSSNIIYDGSDRCEFLRVFVSDLKIKFFFQRHECFYHVEGIESQIIGKGGGR